MLFPRLIELIQTHARSLTEEAVQDLITNPRTPAFRGVPRDELEGRIFTLYHDLGGWIGDRNDDRVRAEYEEWGRRRFDQGIRLSEIIFAIVLLKRHLRRYVKDHGLIDVRAESIVSQELLPLQLHGVQELNYMVGEFFDKALYHLARGYEARAERAPESKSA